MTTANNTSPEASTEASPEALTEALQETAERPQMKIGLALLLTLLSVALLLMAIPPWRISCLAWVALVPFLLAVRTQGAKRGACLGLILGWLYLSLAMYWLIRFGLIAPVTAGLIKSFWIVLLGWLFGVMRPRNSAVYALTVACAWSAQEFIQASGSVGFTLGMLANTQARHPWLLQINSLFGPWTLSFVIAFVNASLADWCWHTLQRRRSASREGLTWQFWRSSHPSHIPLGISVVLLCLTLVFGIVRWKTYQEENSSPIVVGLVQPSAPQNEKFDPDKAPLFLNQLFELSQTAVSSGSQVVIWPETSVPYSNFTKKRSIKNRIRRRISKLGVWCFIGAVARDKENRKLNRMYAFNPHGHLQDTYDKHHLVPFGEFLPLEKYWPDWRILDQIMRFAEGKGNNTIQTDYGKFGVLICFESMTATLPRAQVRNGAEVLVIPTNDGWFGHSAELAAHFDMAILRAVETGRYTMQIGNTGISGFITPLGQVLQESKIEECTALTDTVYAHQDMTLYMRIGDLLPCLMLLWTVLFIFDKHRKPSLFWE
ncbi:MAG: apolipoprotein N-acyltransferase [bacterium]|nr:apolipoprotein N-acyltransferase [bacterium]